MTKPRTAIYVKYKDHTIFKDIDPSVLQPFVREAFGLLDYDGPDFIRLIWERGAENGENPSIKTKASGLLILKADILEMRRSSKCF